MEINNFTACKKICESSTSVVYRGVILDNKTDAVIKIGKNNTDQFIKNEIKITKYVNGGPGIPNVLGDGFHNYKRFILYPYLPNTLYSMDLTDVNLFDCAYQLLESLHFIHNKGIIHRDVSTKNILYNPLTKQFFLNDFGLARHFKFSSEERKKGHVGSPIFCSINVHKGISYSPRDDLISLGYILLWIVHNKNLPWSNGKTCKDIKLSKEKYIYHYFNDKLPKELKIYLNYCFHLEINTLPNYKMLKKLFLIEHNVEEDISIPIST